MAEGTSIMQPVRQAECVKAVRASRGGAVRVTEEEMARATLELAQLGLYTEPTCAQVGRRRRPGRPQSATARRSATSALDGTFRSCPVATAGLRSRGHPNQGPTGRSSSRFVAAPRLIDFLID